jgi:hypothetical protein
MSAAVADGGEASVRAAASALPSTDNIVVLKFMTFSRFGF